MEFEHRLKQVLLDALNHQASDIHLTIEPHQRRIEYRIFNQLKQITHIKVSKDFCEYVKYRSNLDLFTLLKPQTSRIQITLNRKIYYLRVAYVRNLKFENIVLRIMNPPVYLEFSTLFTDRTLVDRIREKLNLTSGLILISGSTGSGKTTTLYTCLKEIHHRKIYTIEDPIEFNYDFLIQLEINPLLNFNFQEAIKQILRHDPNVIVIGEIRDEYEAKAAVRSALSGHLVMSTIHANNVSMTITRLLEFGVSETFLNQALQMVLYQELIYDETTQQRKARFDTYFS